MMTMTELFHGPVEPTWIVHPQENYYRNPYATYRNPYAIYRDDTFNYRRDPYVQRSAVPASTMVAQERAPGPHGIAHPHHSAPVPQGIAHPHHSAPGPQGMAYPNHAALDTQGIAHPPHSASGPQGMAYPHHARYCVHGCNAAIAPVPQVVAAAVPSPVKQSPARPGVLQPRNVQVTNVQTVHFMVPLCCENCENRVKKELLNLDDVQRVTCDQWKQRVTVTSSVAPDKLLKRVQKIKKRSTFWPQQQQSASMTNTQVLVNQNDENAARQLSMD